MTPHQRFFLFGQRCTLGQHTLGNQKLAKVMAQSRQMQPFQIGGIHREILPQTHGHLADVLSVRREMGSLRRSELIAGPVEHTLQPDRWRILRTRPGAAKRLLERRHSTFGRLATR